MADSERLGDWSKLSLDICEALLPFLRRPEISSVSLVNRHWRKSVRQLLKTLRPSRPSVSLSKVFPNLTELDFGKCWRDVTDVVVIALARNLSKSGSLRVFNLAKCHALTNRGIKSIARELPDLETLVLSGCREPFPVPVGRVGYLGVNGETLVGLCKLKHLDLRWNPVNDESLHAVVALTQLTKLVLGECPGVSDKGVLCLSSLTNLISLSLERTMVSDSGLKTVARFPKLEDLSLRNCSEVSDKGLCCLSELSVLNTLDLSRCNSITDLGVERLTSLPSLTSLDVSYCTHIRGGVQPQQHPQQDVDNPGVWPLFYSCFEALSRRGLLRTLKLQDCCNWVTDETLAQAGTIKTLTHLDLENCVHVTDVGLEHISHLPLESLNLCLCFNLTDAGLATLAKVKTLSTVNIAFCGGVSDRGMEHVAKLPNLSSLVLNCCSEISDKGIRALSPLSGVLRHLDFSSCHSISSGCMEFISQMFSELESLGMAWLGICEQDLMCLKNLRKLNKVNVKGCHQLTHEALGELWYLDGIFDNVRTPQQRMQ